MNLETLKNRKDIGSFLNKNYLLGEAAEIGVAYGENAKQILDHWRGVKLHLIDPWMTQPWDEYTDSTNKIDFDGAFKYCMNLLESHKSRIKPIRVMSDDAVKMYRDGFFDFVYLDGNHSEPQITRDLVNWFPKVRKGGIFGGHDYMDESSDTYQCQVKSAVDRFVQERGLKLHTTNGDAYDLSWWIAV